MDRMWENREFGFNFQVTHISVSHTIPWNSYYPLFDLNVLMLSKGVRYGFIIIPWTFFGMCILLRTSRTFWFGPVNTSSIYSNLRDRVSFTSTEGGLSKILTLQRSLISFVFYESHKSHSTRKMWDSSCSRQTAVNRGPLHQRGEWVYGSG